MRAKTNAGEEDAGEHGPELKPEQTDRPWWRRPVVFGALALVVVLAGVVAVQYRPDDSPVRRSATELAAPNFSVPNLRDDAATVELRKLRGKPIVLNFWASWCVPCRKEMPAFESVHSKLGNKVAFLGMNNQDSRDDALGVLRETRVGYPSGFDPSGRVAESYGLRGMPTTVFISAGGRILANHPGEMSEGQLRSAITDLFAVPVPA